MNTHKEIVPFSLNEPTIHVSLSAEEYTEFRQIIDKSIPYLFPLRWDKAA